MKIIETATGAKHWIDKPFQNFPIFRIILIEKIC